MSQSDQIGQQLARGVSRHLRVLGFQSLMEFVPTRGLRVDVIGINPKGEIWIIECKSSRADFMADRKWEGYLEWCDRYFWCVPEAFPVEILPDDHGLILADAYDGEVVRYGPVTPLAGARRKALTLRIARNGLERLSGFTDPRPAVRLAAKLEKGAVGDDWET